MHFVANLQIIALIVYWHQKGWQQPQQPCVDKPSQNCTGCKRSVSQKTNLESCGLLRKGKRYSQYIVESVDNKRSYLTIWTTPWLLFAYSSADRGLRLTNECQTKDCKDQSRQTEYSFSHREGGLQKEDKLRTQYPGQSAEPIPLIAEACATNSLHSMPNATRCSLASLCLRQRGQDKKIIEFRPDIIPFVFFIRQMAKCKSREYCPSQPVIPISLAELGNLMPFGYQWTVTWVYCWQRTTFCVQNAEN